MKQPELGRKLAQLRKEKNLSQEELTEKCYVSVRTIQRIEAGDVTPRGSTIKILLSALDYDFQTFRSEVGSDDKQAGGVGSLFLLNELPTKNYLSVLQIAWISGVVYFVIGIAEGALEYSMYMGYDLDSTGKVFYSLFKLWVLVSYALFARGFVALGQIFNNYLIKVGAYLLIGIMAVMELSDVFMIYLVEDEEIIMFVYAGQSVVSGAIGIIFGIALIRLQDSMGRLSGYAGVLEMIIGASFVTIIFFLIGLALLIPATILEIVLLYKGYDFLKNETRQEPVTT